MAVISASMESRGAPRRRLRRQEGLHPHRAGPDGGDVIGCVYLYPSKDSRYDVSIQSWVSAERAQLDKPLADAVAAWVEEAWPWERVLYR